MSETQRRPSSLTDDVIDFCTKHSTAINTIAGLTAIAVFFLAMYKVFTTKEGEHIPVEPPAVKKPDNSPKLPTPTNIGEGYLDPNRVQFQIPESPFQIEDAPDDSGNAKLRFGESQGDQFPLSERMKKLADQLEKGRNQRN